MSGRIPEPQKPPRVDSKENPFADVTAPILLEATDDAWSRSVSRDIRSDFMWTGMAMALLGVLGSIGAIVAVVISLNSGRADETFMWVATAIGGGGFLLVMAGITLSVIRFGDAMTTIGSAVLGIGISILTGMAMVVLVVAAGVILLFVACLSAISGGQ